MLENEELKEKVGKAFKEKREADDQIEALFQNNKVLNEEKNHFRELCSQFEEKLRVKEHEFINEGMNQIASLEGESLADHIEKYQEAIETGVNETKLKESLLKMLIDYEKTKQKMAQLSFKFEYLAKENEELKNAVHKGNDQDVLKDCVRCREKFSPLLNNEQACVYHAGKLKYYSCRGCGADEYWACCNKCSNCLKGCRSGKHLNA